MRRAVVDVAGEEHDVLHAVVLDRLQEAGDLQLAAQRGAVVAVGQGLLPRAVGDDQAQRQVVGDDLPRGGRRAQPADEPLQLLLAQDRGLVGLEPRGVLALVGAHVQGEHVERRAAGDPAVDAGGLEARAAAQGCGVGDRHVLLPRAAGAGGQRVHVTDLGVARVFEDLTRPPVVGRLVVVPLGDDGDVRVQGAEVVVHHVVAVAAAELVQRLGDLGRLLRDEVAPGGLAGHLEGLRDGVVRVDRVAGVQEEVGHRGVHRRVAAHAADLRVDAVALPRGVRGPHEGLGGGGLPAEPRAGRRREAGHGRLAQAAGLVLERVRHLEAGVGGQRVREDLRGVVGGPVDPAGAQGQPASEAAAQHLPVLVDRAQRGVQARTAGLGQTPGCVASG